MTELCQFAKLHVRPKKLPNCLGEPEPDEGFDSPGAAAEPALRSLGPPDSQPYVVERECDDGWKKTWWLDGEGWCSSRQRPHSMLGRQKPYLCWRRKVPLEGQS